MDVAYLHVVINHLPIMGVPVVLGMLLVGIWSRSDAIQRAALLGFVTLGIATVAVYLTGQGGEDFVEHVPGIDEDAIGAHEDFALFALLAVEALAVFSLLAFLRYGGLSLLRRGDDAGARPVGAGAAWAVVLLAAITSGVLGYTGRLGGRISHTEFAPDGAAVQAAEEDDEGGGRRRRRGRD
jgi:hypothetical protein